MADNVEASKSVSKSVESFTTKFHKQVAGKTDGNFVSSALSAHVVLAMAGYGADGNTAKEIKQTLHLPDNDTLAYQGFQNFIDSLNNVEKVILKVANKLYASSKLSIKDKYKEITGTYFRSECAVIDFSKSTESAAEVNQWCVDKTNGKIKDIITPGDIKSSTGLILLNAVYFKGNWKNKFNKDNTEPKPFHVDKSTTVDVPTMYIKKKFFYKELQELNADIIALPYANEDLSMLIIVPKEIDGIKELEANLEKVDIDYERDLHGYRREVELSLPKFKIESTIDLNPHLNELGMVDMFGSDANFSGISDVPLMVDKVRQKAFIEVNEEGSEAAAVTAISLDLLCLPPPAVVLNVDKPFLYKIVYKTNTLFSGHIANPLNN